MSISGPEAVEILSKIIHRVGLHKKDNTDKFWSYKIKGGKRTEFAFDPRTKNGLYVRVDQEPPVIPGITDIECVLDTDVSTALDRVFSGGFHKARYKATIASETALLAFISHYETLGGT